MSYQLSAMFASERALEKTKKLLNEFGYSFNEAETGPIKWKQCRGDVNSYCGLVTYSGLIFDVTPESKEVTLFDLWLEKHKRGIGIDADYFFWEPNQRKKRTE